MQKGHTETNANQIQELRTESIKKREVKIAKRKKKETETTNSVHPQIYKFPQRSISIMVKEPTKTHKKTLQQIMEEILRNTYFLPLYRLLSVNIIAILLIIVGLGYYK